MEQICSNCETKSPQNLDYCPNCNTILGKLSKDGVIGNRYKIIKLLGKGNMGFVFKALDMNLDRYIALKSISLRNIISPDQKERARKRILREAKSQAKIGDHPNIVIVYDFGLEDDFYYIIMELIVGNDIEYYLKKKTRFPINQILKIVANICTALDYAHKNNIIHRDIKPSNIIITDKNIIKIADFGIAKVLGSDETNITKTGMLVGTPYYMSPEQILGKDLDGRSDIFSLGSIFYKMLTLNNPFQGKGIIQILDAIVTKVPQDIKEINAEVSPEISDIVSKALKKDLSKRYQSAGEMKYDIEKVLHKNKDQIPSLKDKSNQMPSQKEKEIQLKEPVRIITEKQDEQKTMEISIVKPKDNNYNVLIYFMLTILLIIILIFGLIIIKNIRSRETVPYTADIPKEQAYKPDIETIIEETPDETIIEAEDKTIIPDDSQIIHDKEEIEEIFDKVIKNIESMIAKNNFSEASSLIADQILVHPDNPELIRLKNLIDQRLETETDEIIDEETETIPDPDQITALFRDKKYNDIISLFETDRSIYYNSQNRIQSAYYIGYSYKSTGNIDQAYEIFYDVLDSQGNDLYLLEIAEEISHIYSIRNDSISMINIYLKILNTLKDNNIKLQTTNKAYETFSFFERDIQINNISILENINKAFESLNANERIFQSGYDLGILYYNNDEMHNAVNAFNASLKASKKVSSSRDILRRSAVIHYHLGLCYFSINDIKNSIQSFESSLEYFESHEPGSDYFEKSLTNIIRLIPRTEADRRQEYITKAIGYYARERAWDKHGEMSLELVNLIYRSNPQRGYNILSGIQTNQIRDNDIKGRIHYFKALNLILLNKENEAIDNFRSANRFFTQSNNHDQLGMVAYESSKLFFSLRDFNQSLRDISTARRNFDQSGNNYYLAYVIYQEALIYIEQRNRSSARDKVNEGIKLIDSLLKSSIPQSQKNALNELLQSYNELKRNHLL